MNIFEFICVCKITLWKVRRGFGAWNIKLSTPRIILTSKHASLNSLIIAVSVLSWCLGQLIYLSIWSWSWNITFEFTVVKESLLAWTPFYGQRIPLSRNTVNTDSVDFLFFCGITSWSRHVLFNSNILRLRNIHMSSM